MASRVVWTSELGWHDDGAEVAVRLDDRGRMVFAELASEGPIDAHEMPSVGDRVELAPHLELWMRGARFGTVVAVGARIAVELDVEPTCRPRRFLPSSLRIIRRGVGR